MEYWWEAGALITVPFLHEPRQISERGSCGLRGHLTRRFSSCRTAGAGSGDRNEGIPQYHAELSVYVERSKQNAVPE